MEPRPDEVGPLELALYVINRIIKSGKSNYQAFSVIGRSSDGVGCILQDQEPPISRETL